MSDECLCVRVSTTLALQVRFPLLLHRKEKKRNCLLSTVDHVDCQMQGRTSLPHGTVFYEDADPNMIGHQRSSTHGPHFRRAGENFPLATKSDIMYLGVVTLHIHAKATTSMHAKIKHQVSCRSRRWRKIFPTHPVWRSKGVCVPLHSDKVPHDRRKVKVLALRPEKWP